MFYENAANAYNENAESMLLLLSPFFQHYIPLLRFSSCPENIRTKEKIIKPKTKEKIIKTENERKITKAKDKRKNYKMMKMYKCYVRPMFMYNQKNCA